MRCELHDLACGPDGLCVLCRRPPSRVSLASVVVLGLTASGLLLAAGVVRYRTLSARNEVHTLDRAATVTVPRVAPFVPPRTFAAAATRAQLHDEEGPETAPAPAMHVPTPGTVTLGAASPQAPTPETPAPVSLADVDVVVYTTSWCPACKQAKSWMNAHGMAYDERDVEASVAYSRELRSLNPRGSIPTFDVEGQVLVGFSDRALVHAMEQAARRRAERRNY